MVQVAAKVMDTFTNNREHTQAHGQRKCGLLRKKGTCQRTREPTCSEGRGNLARPGLGSWRRSLREASELCAGGV